MKKMANISFAVSFMLFMFCACSSPKTNGSEAPGEVPFEEYTLSKTSLKWEAAKSPADNGVIIINSDEELEHYISCIEGEEYPPIDFANHTLLLARGVEAYANTPGKTRIHRVSTQKYVMNVNLRPSLSAVITNWQVAIIVNKLKDEDTVVLVATREAE